MSYVMSYFIELNTQPTQLLRELLLDVSYNASYTDFFFNIVGWTNLSGVSML